jgi:hypothetical protein
MATLSGVETGPALRRRLLVLSAATIVLALGIAGVSLATVFDRHLERRVAQELQVVLLQAQPTAMVVMEQHHLSLAHQ